MSSMADQMAAAVEQDGGAGLVNPSQSDGVSGNVGVAPSSAGTSNTDTGAAGGTTPESIPYARFKEVNDRLQGLREYEVLRDYGYSPDSLARLAAFEAQYQSDPIGVWRSMADNLDLPQDLRDAIQAQLDAPQTVGTANPPASSAELPDEVKSRLEYVDQLREREEERDREEQLGRVIAAWDALDKQDGIVTPERTKLTYISVAAGSGQVFRTVEDLAQAAREGALEYRSEVLGSAIQRPGGGGAPPALPNSPPAATEPVRFKDLHEASRAALADFQAGRLPTGGQ